MTWDHQPASLMSALPGVTGQSLYDVWCDRARFTESLLPLGEGSGEGVPSTLNSYAGRQLFRVEGKCVLRQVRNGLATKKPIGPCQSVARGIRNPLLTSPSSLLRLLPSTIVKQRCARERGANPWKPICGATFSSWACRCYGPEIFVPYSFPRVNEWSGRKKAARDIRSLFVSAGERIVRAKKGSRRYSFLIRFRGGTNSPGEKRQPMFQRVAIQD